MMNVFIDIECSDDQSDFLCQQTSRCAMEIASYECQKSCGTCDAYLGMKLSLNHILNEISIHI